ncbi:MAG: protein kinase [Myxococcales bacterium]|nr:protein kinase [Myxococcales bacterium]
MKQPIPFGKYYLLERINVGGMAEVFKAKATGVEGFERMVAVKRILPSIAEDEEFITMFIDEAKIAVQLTHANIAQIFDLGRFDSSYYIALEYVHGKDMRAIFNRARSRGEQLPVPMACYGIMKVCEGLDYAHNKRDAAGSFLNLVHRDVSPQNILFSYEGEVKIIDFGIAKAAGKAGKTQAGILKGKFGYMSPEQVQGMEIDRRSDIFGVGICLYELLTGERLFVGESDFATLEKVRNVDIMPPSTYNRRIPDELEKIVLKALARDRDHRHQTAMQLHDELQSFMYGSGNFFGRRDLSMYMHRVFAAEIQRESARDQEYAALNVVHNDPATGLNAFDELDQVSTVSALNLQPDYASQPRAQAPQYAPRPQTPAPPARPMMSPPSAPGVPRKSTLLGMPAARAQAPSVPGLIPNDRSIPPNNPRLPPQANAGPPAQVGMDWDDDELSTQIYDRPEDDSEPALMAVNAGDLALGPGSGRFPVGHANAQAGHFGHPVPPAPARPEPGFAPAPAPSFADTPRPGHVMTQPGLPTEMGMPAAGRSERRRTMVVAGAAVAAIVAIIVVGLVLFRPPTPGTVHLSTTPGDVSVTIDGVPVTGSSPFVIGEVVPKQPHEIVVSKTGYRPWSSRFELQPDEMMQLPPVKLELLESGFALSSEPPGAAVFVDNRKLPQTTPLRVIDLSPGDHQIRLEAEGFAPWGSSLHVTPGTVLDLPQARLIPSAAAQNDQDKRDRGEVERPRPQKRDAPMVKRPPPREKPPVEKASGSGTLRVQTRPWSKVFVDGRLIGTTPQMAITVSAGRHTVTFRNPDFGLEKTIQVNVKNGEVVTKILNLSP